MQSSFSQGEVSLEAGTPMSPRTPSGSFLKPRYHSSHNLSALSPDTSPLILLDRLTRLDVNRLFSARGGAQFRLELTGGELNSVVQNHAGKFQDTQCVPKRSVIGIGMGAHYTLYDPGSDHIDFRTATKQTNARNRGFGLR